jgi:CBS domain-containing protein
MVPEGLITVEDISIAKYAHRDLPSLRASLLVGELMTTEVTAAHTDAPLLEVVNLLIGRDFRALPVVDADEQVVGIITNGDLVERGRLPARIELLSAMDPVTRDVAIRGTATLSASDVMTPNPVLIGPEQPIEDAVGVMLSRRLKRLPVVDVDADHRLRGMISRVDLLRAFGEAYPRPIHEEPSPRRADTVADVMNRQPPVVREEALLAEVLDAVVSTRLNRAVVVDAEGRVLGVVSDADVLSRLDPHLRSGVVGALMNREKVIPEAAGRVTARELIVSPAITVTADVPVSEAARRIVAQRHKMLPVVDEEGRLLGIVDRAHLLRASRLADSGQSV